MSIIAKVLETDLEEIEVDPHNLGDVMAKLPETLRLRVRYGEIVTHHKLDLDGRIGALLVWSARLQENGGCLSPHEFAIDLGDGVPLFGKVAQDIGDGNLLEPNVKTALPEGSIGFGFDSRTATISNDPCFSCMQCGFCEDATGVGQDGNHLCPECLADEPPLTWQ